MPTWPATLPQDLALDGYREKLPSGVIRDDFDVGPATTRRRSTASTFQVSSVMHVTVEQWLDLADFFADDLKGGALAFDFPKQASNGDSPGDSWLVRFLEPPERSGLSTDLFSVTISLEVLP